MPFPRRIHYTTEDRQRGVEFAEEPEIQNGDTLVSSPVPALTFLTGSPTFTPGGIAVAGTQVVFEITNPAKGLYQFLCSVSTAAGKRLTLPCELEVPY